MILDLPLSLQWDITFRSNPRATQDQMFTEAAARAEPFSAPIHRMERKSAERHPHRHVA